ncbi:MAG: ABC transporter permease [Kiritimatiellia bacterium]
MLYPILVFRSLWRDKARTACALFGIAAAVGLLAWHLGLTDTALHGAEVRARQSAAPFPAWATGPMRGPAAPGGAGGARQPDFRRRAMRLTPLPAAFVQSHPEAILLTVESAQVDIRPGGSPLQGPPLFASVCAWPDGGIPFANQTIDGSVLALFRAAATEEGEAVPALFSTSLFSARIPAPEIGSTLDLILARGTLTLQVAGFFESDGKIREFPSIYIPDSGMARLRRLVPFASKGPNLALLPKLPENRAEEMVRLTTCTDLAVQFRGDAVQHLIQSLPLSLSLAVLTAIVMLITSLCSGLSAERRRLALLRCAGMTRRGVAGLVLLETSILSFAGWVIGSVAGLLLLQAFLALGHGADFAGRVYPGAYTVLGTAALAFFASLVASFVPMLLASRVRPLEAFPESEAGLQVKFVSVRRTVLGVFLLLPMPLLAFSNWFSVSLRTTLLIVIGLPCVFAGTVLLVHPVIRLLERIGLHPLGALLRLEPILLSRRLSRSPGRALGVVLSIALGLGSYVAIHTWGASLIVSYIPSPEWPDAIVSFLPTGLKPEQAQWLGSVLTEGKTAPLSQVAVIEATQLPPDPGFAESIRARGGRIAPRAVLLLFGIDPAATFAPAGDRHARPPLLPAKWLEGTPEEAVRAMEAGDGAVIPVMLSRLTGLHVGDVLPFADGTEVRIAGVIDLNWHMVTSRALVRTRFAPFADPSAGGAGGAPGGPTYGMVFVSEGLARSVSQETDTVRFLWCQMSPEMRSIYPLDATVRLDAAIRAALAEQTDGTAALASNSIQVHHRDEIADGTISHGNNILGTMGRIPFWSLVVTCFGIAALAAATRRALRQESAVLRAVGMTRGQLSRLFLGEMILVILCTLFLSLIVGLLLGWSFTGITRENLNAGLAVRFIVPWAEVLRGFALAGGLSFALAALSTLGIRPAR